MRSTVPALRAPPLALLALVSCGAGQEILDGARCLAHVKAQVALGPRPSGSPALEKTRAYIVEQLQSFGLAPVVDEFAAQTSRGPVRMANVRCDIAGRSKSIVVLVAHYDTKRITGIEFVGANDGASGVAVLLEIARHFSKENRPPVTLRVLFVDGEETQAPVEEARARHDWNEADALYGSRHEVERARKAGELASVKAVICLDMVGDRDLTIVEESSSSPRMIAWAREAAKEGGVASRFFSSRQQVIDDHVPFARAGVEDTLDLIDFEYGAGNRHWHTREDTLDKISGESLRAVGDVVIRMLPKIAKQFP